MAHAIASSAPSVARALDLWSDHPERWNLEPAAYQVLQYAEGAPIVTYTAYVETFAGPFPFVTDPHYPGKTS